MKKFGSGMEKSRIRDKHPASATLIPTRVADPHHCNADPHHCNADPDQAFHQCYGSELFIPDPHPNFSIPDLESDFFSIPDSGSTRKN